MQLVDRRTYRAKKPANARGYVNDRTIVYLSSSSDQVQYDGPAIAIGRLRPCVAREEFEKWASHDVTDQLPAGEYMTWAQYKKNEEQRVCQKLGIE